MRDVYSYHIQQNIVLSSLPITQNEEFIENDVEHDVPPLQIDESMLLPFDSHDSSIILNVANDFYVQENT